MTSLTETPVQDLGDEDEAYIARNPDGSVTLTLRYPVTVASRTSGGDTTEEMVADLICRRLTGRNIREAAEKKGAAGTTYLLTASTGKPALVFDRLDAEDYRRLAEVVVGFTGASRPTG